MTLKLFIVVFLTFSIAKSESYDDSEKQRQIELQNQQRAAFLANKSILDLALFALEQSLADQVIAKEDKYYLSGEFTTQIQSTPVPSLLGVGRVFKEDDEATGFTTGSVVNLLAQTYLDFPQYKTHALFSKIPEVVSKAVATFARYESGELFNFYPPLEWKGKIVRRPIAMRLLPWWHGLTNIPNDADSTSVMVTAKLMNAKLNSDQKFTPSKELFDIFSKFRDIDRKPMYYNKGENRINTHGFLTWLMDEKDPNMPHNYFAASGKGQRIPFNKNDVDCIVNANVLKLISVARKSSLPDLQVSGEQEACSMLNDMIIKNEQAKCGIYYPNTLNLAFSMAQAEKAGNTCLANDTKSELVIQLLKLQAKEGYWKNKGNFWKDKVLTTAFAMYALLHFGDKENIKIKNSLINGVRFLVNSLKSKDQRFYWPADHYFTAVAIARSLVMWESKAYTHAIISDVLLRFHKAYPEINEISDLEENTL